MKRFLVFLFSLCLASWAVADDDFMPVPGRCVGAYKAWQAAHEEEQAAFFDVQILLIGVGALQESVSGSASPSAVAKGLSEVPDAWSARDRLFDVISDRLDAQNVFLSCVLPENRE